MLGVLALFAVSNVLFYITSYDIYVTSYNTSAKLPHNVENDDSISYYKAYTTLIYP